jgi:hypothetical protein
MLNGALVRLVYAACLAILIVNDRMLKPSGAWPLLSGKLSDFAGLVVAPVTLTAFVLWLAPRWRGARARLRVRCIGFGLAGLVFSTINLSPLASEWFVSALRVAGIEWRLWSDPTDLVALLALPCAWVLLDALERQPARGLPWQTVEVAGVFLGALSCLASGDPYGPDHGTAFIVNASGMRLQLRSSRLLGERDCTPERVPFEDGVLRATDFGPAGTVEFPAGDAYHLFGRSWEVSSPEDLGAHCNPVRIAVWPADGDESEAVSAVIEGEPGGNEGRSLHPRPSAEEQRNMRRLVRVVKKGEGLELQIGPELRSLTLAEGEAPPPPLGCELRPAPRMSPGPASGILAAIEPIGDRCYDLLLVPASTDASGSGGSEGAGGTSEPEPSLGGQGGGGGDGWQPPELQQGRRISLCVDVVLPFRVGDFVSIPSDGTSRSAISSGARWLVLVEDDEYRVSTDSACPQVRDACGAVWLTEDADVSTPVSPRARDLPPDVSGAHIANTYRVLLGRKDCPDHLTTPARRAEWIEVSY